MKIKKSPSKPLHRTSKSVIKSIALCGLLSFSASVLAGSPGDRILATGGVTQFEGSAGGGLTPWALIAGYGTREQIGGTVAYTKIGLDDYDLDTYGFAVGFYDRVELSYSRQSLDVGSFITSTAFSALSGGAVTAAPSTKIDQDIFGLKVKVYGDAVFSQASWAPQIALGIQHKRNKNFDSGLDASALGAGNIGIPALLGASEDSGTDLYVAMTKAFLGVPGGRNLLLNLTARATKANTFGLLGFENAADDDYKLALEGSLGLFLSPSVLVGFEFRDQPNQLAKQGGLSALAKTDTAYDVFVAYVPNKRFSITAAYVDVGNLPLQEKTDGAYVSIEASF